MASGDLKGEECVVITVTSGGAVAVGDLVHIELDDGFWDTGAANDAGKFGVALDAAAGAAVNIRVCIWGRVEVKATAAAIAKGAYVVAGATGFVVDAGTMAETTVYGTIAGTAMTAFGANGQGVIWVGLGV